MNEESGCINGNIFCISYIRYEVDKLINFVKKNKTKRQTKPRGEGENPKLNEHVNNQKNFNNKHNTKMLQDNIY